MKLHSAITQDATILPFILPSSSLLSYLHLVLLNEKKKLSLYLIKRHAMKKHGGVEVYRHEC
jgi:hypothetical protein